MHDSGQKHKVYCPSTSITRPNSNTYRVIDRAVSSQTKIDCKVEQDLQFSAVTLTI